MMVCVVLMMMTEAILPVEMVTEVDDDDRHRRATYLSRCDRVRERRTSLVDARSRVPVEQRD